MKLSKVLLSAIVAGVAVTATSSCSKESKEVAPVESPTSQETAKPHNQIPFDCPACGMG